jgi:hypothetical protein
MVGHAGSFHPFLHDVTRPHPTQIEVANLRRAAERVPVLPEDALVVLDLDFSLVVDGVLALTVEAMVGHAGSFHPFLHDVTRPHPTQIEVARKVGKADEPAASSGAGTGPA